MRIKSTSGRALAAGLAALLLVGMGSAPPRARAVLADRAEGRATLSGEARLALGRSAHVDTTDATPAARAPWRVVSRPIGGLAGISAVLATDIWAVGATGQAGREQPLITHWDGRGWRTVPGPAAGAPGRLSAVAALASDDVWAVGDQQGQPLIEHWDGRRWRAVPGARPGPAGGGLRGVAAVSSRDVWAVGDALIEHWDGKSWRVIPSPSLGPLGGRLTAVAGITADDVWAVGSYGKNYYYGDALIEHWDGKSWRVVPSPDVPNSALAHIAVVSRHDAWAVGGALVEHWDGARWRQVPSPSGGVGALAVVSPGDVWGAGGTLAHYTGALCYAPDARTRTIALPNVGIQGEGEGTASDAPGALAVDGATGHAFVRDTAGTVSALDPARGAILHSIHAGATAGPLAVDEQGGRVFVPVAGEIGTAGSVTVLDTATGALSRAIPAAPRTSLVAADARSGHLFVAATGATIATVPISNPTALAVDSAAGRVYSDTSHKTGTTSARPSCRSGCATAAWTPSAIPRPSRSCRTRASRSTPTAPYYKSWMGR